ncbi:MAG: hypothetical protein ACI4AK_05255 [Lepagella sp.]
MKHLKNVNGIALICRNVINQGKKANQNMPTLADFETAKACGFNAVMYPGSDVDPDQWISYTKDALDYCQQTGLILISNSPILQFNSKVKGVAPYAKDWPVSFVSQFVNHPALGGWQVKDEPQYLDWHDSIESDSSAQEHDSPLIQNFKDIKAADGNNLVFMNLAVSYEHIWIGKQPSYAQYLRHFNEVFNPSILCYDYYPIDCIINSEGEVTSFRVHWDTFYSTLATFANEARRSNKTFWTYCLCYKHDTGGRVYPFPTESMLRFYVFSSLAYGAQGIIYWKYRLEVASTPKDEENNSNGSSIVNGWPNNQTPGGKIDVDIMLPSDYKELTPIDYNGKKTSIWYSIQKINKEVVKYNDIFYNCNVLGTYISPQNNKIMDTHIGCINQLKAEGVGVLISHIVNKGKYYILIVNSDPFNPQKFKFRKYDISEMMA